MKKIFKKSMAVFMAVLMLVSVMSVSVFAATMYQVSFEGGNNGTLIEGEIVPVTQTIEKGKTMLLPGAVYTRQGYTQTGWCTSKTGTSGKFGDVNQISDKTVTKKMTLYPYWTINTYEVKFIPGEGVGTEVKMSVDYNKTVSFPVAFTREDYVQIGWAAVIDSEEKEFDLTGKTPRITDNTVFYPIWEKCDYTVEVSATSFDFGHVCVGYSAPASQQVVITNKGNMSLNYDLPPMSGYEVVCTDGQVLKEIAPGESRTVNIRPNAGLSAGDHSATLLLDCNKDVSDVRVNVSFTVNEHSFDKYYSDGNASYEANGTKTAECSNGCGATDTVEDFGSMKVYSADNNTVDGLLKEYLYHKTVRATAYGSGTDNFAEDGSVAEGTKRFLPVSWYVNDDFNGEFKDDNFTINFVHTSFGKYTLKVKYVEQQYVDGEWVETGVEDEKSFDYYVGPSAEEEQEVVRPNMILSIIFGIFTTLAELFSGLFA